MLTEAFEVRLLQGMTSRIVPPPQYCAVGAGRVPVGDEPWRQSILQAEMARLRITGAFVDPLSGRSVLVTAFRSSQVNTIWTELALFDEPELANYGDRSVTSCDSLNIPRRAEDDPNKQWTTGSGNTIFLDPSLYVEGFGMLFVQAVDASAASASPPITDNRLLFSNQGLGLDSSGMDQLQAKLQMHIFVSDIVGVNATALTIRLFNKVTDTANYYSWTVAASALASGFNFIQLGWKDVSTTGSPTFSVFRRIEIDAFSRTGTEMIFGLDGIRLFQDSGTMFARAEINPSLIKDVGTTKVVSWTVDPLSQL